MTRGGWGEILGGGGGHGVREGERTARMYITDLSEEDIEISIKVSKEYMEICIKVITAAEGTNSNSSDNTSDLRTLFSLYLKHYLH